MTPVTADHTPERLAWGESPYDGRSPREVVDDYVLVRGDLVAEYAREQLATWIERYAAAHLADVKARLAAVEALVRELHISGDLTPAGTDAMLRALHPDSQDGA